MKWRQVYAGLCVFIPLVAVGLSLLWMLVWSVPSFGTIIVLVLSTASLVLGFFTCQNECYKSRRRTNIIVHPHTSTEFPHGRRGGSSDESGPSGDSRHVIVAPCLVDIASNDQRK